VKLIAYRYNRQGYKPIAPGEPIEPPPAVPSRPVNSGSFGLGYRVPTSIGFYSS
jgi:hypothetical protein